MNSITPKVITLVSLLIIVLLVYIQKRKIELFDNSMSANDIILNSPLINFINTYTNKQKQQNAYKTILNNRQIQIINPLATKVVGIINPSRL